MIALKILKEMDLKASCAKHPTFPSHLMAVTKFTDKTANGLTKCIVSFINMNGGLAERISNTGRWMKGESVVDVIGIQRNFNGKYIPGTGLNGTADISATICGRSVAVEVKIGKDRQSDAQKEYQQRIENAGGLYVIAKDFQSFYDWYCVQFTNK